MKGGSNLHIIAVALVCNDVLSDSQDGGLDFTGNATSYTLNATKEVRTCSRATKSPQMLELYGIRDAELLGSFGIETWIDNPSVGVSLQDRPQCRVPFGPN